MCVCVCALKVDITGYRQFTTVPNGTDPSPSLIIRHPRECMEVNGEALQLHTVHKKPYFVLQVA